MKADLCTVHDEMVVACVTPHPAECQYEQAVLLKLSDIVSVLEALRTLNSAVWQSHTHWAAASPETVRASRAIYEMDWTLKNRDGLDVSDLGTMEEQRFPN